MKGILYVFAVGLFIFSSSVSCLKRTIIEENNNLYNNKFHDLYDQYNIFRKVGYKKSSTQNPCYHSRKSIRELRNSNFTQIITKVIFHKTFGHPEDTPLTLSFDGKEFLDTPAIFQCTVKNGQKVLLVFHLIVCVKEESWKLLRVFEDGKRNNARSFITLNVLQSRNLKTTYEDYRDVVKTWYEDTKNSDPTELCNELITSPLSASINADKALNGKITMTNSVLQLDEEHNVEIPAILKCELETSTRKIENSYFVVEYTGTSFERMHQVFLTEKMKDNMKIYTIENCTMD